MRQQPRSDHVQEFLGDVDRRTPNAADVVTSTTQRPRSGRLQGFSRGQNPRERILALRITAKSE
jgi:hypothetical protein